MDIILREHIRLRGTIDDRIVIYMICAEIKVKYFLIDLQCLRVNFKNAVLLSDDVMDRALA